MSRIYTIDGFVNFRRRWGFGLTQSRSGLGRWNRRILRVGPLVVSYSIAVRSA